MNRLMSYLPYVLRGMPHVCGDEPDQNGKPLPGATHAPRMWG